MGMKTCSSTTQSQRMLWFGFISTRASLNSTRFNAGAHLRRLQQQLLTVPVPHKKIIVLYFCSRAHRTAHAAFHPSAPFLGGPTTKMISFLPHNPLIRDLLMYPHDAWLITPTFQEKLNILICHYIYIQIVCRRINCFIFFSTSMYIILVIVKMLNLNQFQYSSFVCNERTSVGRYIISLAYSNLLLFGLDIFLRRYDI